MKQCYENLLLEMEQQLASIHSFETLPLQYSEQASVFILDILKRLKAEITNHNFESESEEIAFFKYIKPQFTHRLIFYNAIYHIESSKPYGSIKVIRKYYKHELEKLQQHCLQQYEFIRYYRTGNAHLDHRYFLRGHFDLCLLPSPLHYDADQRFSTTHDSKIATLLAHEKLQVYLEQEIIKIEQKDEICTKVNINYSHKWTASKVSLIELIYALHAEGVFNNGATELKDAISLFESVFNINLGQFHRTFLEIRGRKIERTRFLTGLRERLLQRMDSADDRF